MIPGGTFPEAAMTVLEHRDGRQARRLATWLEV
jgi:hypothetical protein